MAHFFAQMTPVAWIGAFFLGWFLLWLPIAIPLIIYLKWQPLTPFTAAQKLPLLVSLYAIAPFLLWAFAHVQHTSLATYGLSGDIQFGRSVLLGWAIASVGLALLLGIQQWQVWSVWQAGITPLWLKVLLPSSLLGLWISTTEEMIFRGFLVNHLLDWGPVWVAAIAASIIFAILHLVWEQRETLPQLPGLWLMGMVLILARWADHGSLGLAIGLHAGWVGGMISLDSAQILQYRDRAPVWFVGVAQKPLAGLGGIGLLLLTGGVVYAIAQFS